MIYIDSKTSTRTGDGVKDARIERSGCKMEDELMRIGVSIPADLLFEFDQAVSRRGYSSRSEAIRDAIRGYLADYELFSKSAGDQIGVITLVYSHEQRGLISLLTDIQHENAQIITSTIHIHLDAENCLEIDVVRGSADEIRKFAERVMVQSGVFHVRVFFIPAPASVTEKRPDEPLEPNKLESRI